MHFNPDLLLKWSHQFAALKLSASVDVSIDRFFTETDQDGGLTASFTDGRSDLFVPYLSYNVTAELRPDFGKTDDVLHGFSAGFVSGIAYRNAGSLLRRRVGLDLWIYAEAQGAVVPQFRGRIPA